MKIRGRRFRLARWPHVAMRASSRFVGSDFHSEVAPRIEPLGGGRVAACRLARRPRAAGERYATLAALDVSSSNSASSSGRDTSRTAAK